MHLSVATGYNLQMKNQIIMIVRLICSFCKNNIFHLSTEPQCMGLPRHKQRNCLRYYE